MSTLPYAQKYEWIEVREIIGMEEGRLEKVDYCRILEVCSWVMNNRVMDSLDQTRKDCKWVVLEALRIDIWRSQNINQES